MWAFPSPVPSQKPKQHENIRGRNALSDGDFPVLFIPVWDRVSGSIVNSQMRMAGFYAPFAHPSTHKRGLFEEKLQESDQFGAD